jgi:hypothetical protein
VPDRRPRTTEAANSYGPETCCPTRIKCSHRRTGFCNSLHAKRQWNRWWHDARIRSGTRASHKQHRGLRSPDRPPPARCRSRTLGVRRLHDRVPRPGGALGLGGRHGVPNARVAGRNRRHRVGVARGEHISAGLSRADIDAPRPLKIGVPGSGPGLAIARGPCKSAVFLACTAHLA